MKQIIQDLSSGETKLIEVPIPSIGPNEILIKSSKSLISKGTEKMLIDFGQSNWINRIRQQPEKVKDVLGKAKLDGISSAYGAVTSKLNQPVILGYSNVGKVIESNVNGFSKGDRVISNGPHSEIILSTKNLCAKIPDNIDDESASFTVVGSIALQGIRLANPSIGENFVVIGLGLIGLLTVQILKANGCKVLGIDLDSKKCEKAKNFGAEVIDLSKNNEIISRAKNFSNGMGVDGVIITANTKSNDPVTQAAKICRKKARIILVGVTGLQLNRQDFYEKELTFQVSCSYGPGRYDDFYELEGHDYPIGHVRWTENRNFEAFLDLLSNKYIDVKSLISDSFSIDKSIEAYKLLEDNSSLGILLEYPYDDEDVKKSINLHTNEYKKHKVRIGAIGAGNYASRFLIPAFKKAGVKKLKIASKEGLNATVVGKKNNFEIATSNQEEIFKDANINTVVISTRHNQHADQVCKSLESKKNVFVEKPLAINLDEIEKVKKTFLLNPGSKLMVGFNRRFSPLTLKMKKLIKDLEEPKALIFTVNSGFIPIDHWTQNIKIGGGRLIGEVCHFVDLMRYLVGHKITDFSVLNIETGNNFSSKEDKVCIIFSFEDGSIGNINYLSNGGNLFPKERIEIFCKDAVLQNDNFKTLKGFNWRGFKKKKLFSQNKGNYECVKAFVDSIEKGLDTPIPFDEIIEVAETTIKISNKIRNFS